jgi:hypothetical protein
MTHQETAKEGSLANRNIGDSKFLGKVSLKKKASYSYEIITQKTTNGRVYQLIKMSLPPVGVKRRKRILERFLEKENALGLIEWWAHGSLAERPWRDFCIILILNRQ